MRTVELDARGFGAVTNLMSTPAADAWDGINDGLHGGLGGFGVHVLLPNGEHRHLDSCHWASSPGRDWCGVRATWGQGGERVSSLGWGERRMFGVTHRWNYPRSPVTGPAVEIEIKVLEGAEGCWFKEPKVCANGFRFSPGVVRQLDRAGTVLRRHLVVHKTNPRASTQQMTHPQRHKVSLGLRGRVKVWCDDHGLNEWRRDVLELDPPPRQLEPKNYDAAYCHSNTLRSSWEFVRWPTRCGILFCAWTGGAGQHECWGAGRPAVVGNTYRVRLGIEGGV